MARPQLSAHQARIAESVRSQLSLHALPQLPPEIKDRVAQYAPVLAPIIFRAVLAEMARHDPQLPEQVRAVEAWINANMPTPAS